ncbi:hypothetical protein GCM10023314_26440 [Algibacter agarivorans]|uniref:Phage integrase SAM-like domain-containing protein n=1 Tax=Algibacter agarivorans TaxID=1109741 RepID=A0ABP9GVD6_9FLAO
MRNPKIRYYLEAKYSDINQRTRQELIMAEINYGYSVIDKNGNKRNKPFRITLEATIQPKNFGLSKENYKFDEEVFKRFSKSNATIKTKMHLMETAINKLTNNYLVSGEVPTPEDFKKALKIELGQIKVVNEVQQTILDFVYSKIKSDEENLQISQKKGISEGTIKCYRTLSHHIENYQIATGDILTFGNFDDSKYWIFWRVLNDIFKDKIELKNPNQPRKQRKNKNGYTSNALQRYQKNLLAVLRLAKKKYSIALDLDDETLTLEDSESMKDFYVDEVELQKIINTDVSFDVKMQRAKEYSIVSSLTGLRFGSMEDIINKDVQIYSDDGYDFKYVHSKHFKTNTEVCIPLLKPVIDIINSHGGKFPRFTNNPTINEDLKSLFNYVKINDLVTLTRVTFNDGTIIEKVPKSEAISTHDFKSSFYSNLYKRKLKASIIDNITHPDRAPKNPMARIYNKTDMLDKAKMFIDEINKINSEIYKM